MNKRASLISFVLVTAVLGGYYGAPFFFDKGDRRVHLPGETSAGHHQIEIACKQCHTPFGGVKNDACNTCHAAGLESADNSHNAEKFADPRNADRISALDAQKCTTCHREHVPDETRAGVTIAADFCVKCHEDVFTERPTHAALPRDSCGNAGCHNFHDNRALYADFLLEHLDEPALKTVARVRPLAATSSGKESRRALAANDQDAPASANLDPAIIQEWETTAHAKSGVNCTDCHRENDTAGDPVRWTKKVDHAACARCHRSEDEGFLKGRHGMRIAAGLTPMTPGMARLPMKPDAKDRELDCGSCHAAHDFDTRKAAVESCLGCHDDAHSLAYKSSRHYQMWNLEQEGHAEAGTGVSCATCHLPRESHRQDGAEVIAVQHDQNDNLRPSDKMLRSVCMSCHGLAFSMDSLADTDLVRRNFNGKPQSRAASLEMAKKRANPHKPGD
jgi:predicted CXXCH cytochrome family protein